MQERINTYDTAHKIGIVAKMPTNIYLKNNSNPVSVSVAPPQQASHLCDRTPCPRPARWAKPRIKAIARTPGLGVIALAISKEEKFPLLASGLWSSIQQIGFFTHNLFVQWLEAEPPTSMRSNLGLC